MKVAISGATGFIGAHLCSYYAARGAEVRALVRTATRDPNWPVRVRSFDCELPDRLDEHAFDGGLDAVIHCAYETRRTDPANAERTNVRGSERLIGACRAHGVQKFAFLSSMSADEAAESYYGRSKRKVETLLDPARDLVIRPGLAIGRGGIFWRIAEAIRRFRLIPIFFGGGQLVQTIAVDDLCAGIALAVDLDLHGTLHLAEERPVPLSELFRATAEALSVRAVEVRLPGNALLRVLRSTERWGVRLPISSENLLGLKALRVFDVSDDLRRLGLRPRPMREALEALRA